MLSRRTLLKMVGLGAVQTSCGLTLATRSPILAAQPPVAGAMPVGINAGFYGGLEPAAADLIASWGNVVVRAAVNDVSECAPILDSFKATDVRVLFCVDVFDGAIVQQVGSFCMGRDRVFGIELFNETVYDNIDAQTFGRAVGDLERWLRDQGYTGIVISGGIPNTQPASLEYLRAAMIAGAWRDVVPGVHRYSRDGEPLAPSKGFATRDDEWRYLANVCGPRWALTEFGYVHDGRDEATIANYAAIDLAAAQAHGAIVACLYQINDGTTTEAIDRFGVRTFGGDVRPIASVLKAWGTR